MPEGVLQALAMGRAPEHSFEAVIRGHSMGPSIPDGCRVHVHPPAQSPIHPGSVVLHKAVNGLLVAHRMAAMGRSWSGADFVITQGDGQLLCDMPLSMQELMGAVTGVWDPKLAQWIAPQAPPPVRSGIALTVAKMCLVLVKLWATVAGATQRRWLSRNLLRFRRSSRIQ